MANVVFRRAIPGDVPGICRVRLAVRENRLSDPSLVPPERVLGFLQEHGRGWVAESEDGIVGFSIGDARDATVWALFVAPGAEGHGIGGRLHDLVVDWLWETGAACISLATEPGTRAERFYRARGWVPCGFRENGDRAFVLCPPPG